MLNNKQNLLIIIITTILSFNCKVVVSQINIPPLMQYTSAHADTTAEEMGIFNDPYQFFKDSIFNWGNYIPRGLPQYLAPNHINNCSFATSFFDIGIGKNYYWNGSQIPRQLSVSYTLSNNTANNEVSVLGATGITKSGWAVAGGITGRYGNVWNYTDGTSLTGIDYFFTIEKVINKYNSFNLKILGSETHSDLASPSFNETQLLANTPYYNPNWGWYQGVKRNSEHQKISSPTAILSYTHDNGDDIQLNANIFVGINNSYTTHLNWGDAPIPFPDYYINLPSYYEGTPLDSIYTDGWSKNANIRQINWDNIYATNQLAEQQGEAAQYILEERWKRTVHFGGDFSEEMTFNDKFSLDAGVKVKGRRDHYYKTIDDLLGGGYWIDQERYLIEDQPAENSTLPMNNLLEPNKQIGENGIFGYDYIITTFHEQLWANGLLHCAALDFRFGAKVGLTQLFRDGKMQNGRDVDNSFGKSGLKSFFNYGANAGFNTTFSKNHLITFHAQFQSGAPETESIFFAKNFSNALIPNIKNQNLIDGNLSYTYQSPKITIKVEGFAAYLNNATQNIFAFHDDRQNYVNYGLTDLDQLHVGVEWLGTFKVHPTVELFVAGSYGDYTYTNNPTLYVAAENGIEYNNIAATEGQTVQWKGNKVGGMPQTVNTLGVKMNFKGWKLMLNGNFYGKMYAAMNPERRTEAALDGFDATTQEEILKQDKYKGQFTADISISKEWQIKKNMLGFTVAVKNVTHNLNFTQWAHEPYRFNTSGFGTTNYQNRTSYAYGAMFWATLHFKI